MERNGRNVVFAVGGIAVIRLAVILTLLTAITAQAWTQEMLMRKAYGVRGGALESGFDTAITLMGEGQYYVYPDGITETNASCRPDGSYYCYSTNANPIVGATTGGGAYFAPYTNASYASPKTMPSLTNFTIFSWVLMTSQQGINVGCPTVMFDSLNRTSVGATTINRRLLFYVYNSSSSCSVDLPSTGAWYFVSATYSASNAVGDGIPRLYTNGIFASQGASKTTIGAAGTLKMGRLPSADRYFPGYIGFSGVAYRALSSNDIDSVYQATRRYYE
jgi:hypothetical protein